MEKGVKMRLPNATKKNQREDFEDVSSHKNNNGKYDLKRRKHSRDSLNDDEGGEETELIKFSIKKHAGAARMRQSKGSQGSDDGGGEIEETDSKCDSKVIRAKYRSE